MRSSEEMRDFLVARAKNLLSNKRKCVGAHREIYNRWKCDNRDKIMIWDFVAIPLTHYVIILVKKYFYNFSVSVDISRIIETIYQK